MQINKVAFIGKGGVGLLYGSMIAKALGNDAVEYVMDDTRFERHANDALTVNGKPCDLTSVRASEATPADLVILTVKTTGLDQALKTMERVVGPNTLIASLCNGITSEQKIAERFGWEHTVLGICQGMDAVFLNGALTFTNAGEIRFGAAAGTNPATITAIDELYTRCGIAHTVEDDIAHRMWAKLMLNDGINQTCMAYGGTYGSATEPGSEQRRCFVSAMRETLAVANAEGVELTEADLTQMVHLIEGIDPAGMPSMAQDRIARRKTEVDEFAGTICRLAAKHDIQAPQTSGSIGASAISRKAGSADAPHSTALTAKPPQGNLSPAAAFIFVYDRRPISQQLALRPRHLVLIVAAKNHACASQQRGRDQRADHDRSSPACPLHVREERGRGTKAAKHQRDGGNGNISSIHKTTSSKRKTLFLKNQCAPHPYAQRTATVRALLTQTHT